MTAFAASASASAAIAYTAASIDLNILSPSSL